MSMVIVGSLRSYAIVVSRLARKVLRMTREDNLLCMKKYQLCTTDLNHGERVFPNIAQRMRVRGIIVSCITI